MAVPNEPPPNTTTCGPGGRERGRETGEDTAGVGDGSEGLVRRQCLSPCSFPPGRSSWTFSAPVTSAGARSTTCRCRPSRCHRWQSWPAIGPLLRVGFRLRPPRRRETCGRGRGLDRMRPVGLEQIFAKISKKAVESSPGPVLVRERRQRWRGRAHRLLRRRKRINTRIPVSYCMESYRSIGCDPP